MKQQKNQPQTPAAQVPVNAKREVSQVDIQRAENEGMTLTPKEVPATPKRDVSQADIQRAEGEGMTLTPTPTPKVDTKPEDLKVDKTDGIEGEGSYTAARRYREGLEESVQKGDAEKLAEQAADALDGPEGADLRHAEQRGMMTPPGVQQKPQGKPQRSGDKQQPVSHR